MKIIPYQVELVEKNVIKVLAKLGPGMPRKLMKEEEQTFPELNYSGQTFMPAGHFGVSYIRTQRITMLEFQLIHEQFADLGIVILDPIRQGAETKIDDRHPKSPTVEEAKYYYSKGWAPDFEYSFPNNRKHEDPDLEKKLIDNAYYFFTSKHLVDRCEKIRTVIIQMIINEVKTETNEPWKWIPDLSPKDKNIYRQVWEAKSEGLSWEKTAEHVDKAVNSVKSYHRKMQKVMKD